MSNASDRSEVLVRYFRALEATRFEEAAECFTEDVYYIHPPFPFEPPGSAAHAVKGRAALLRLWREVRGNLSALHHIGPCVASGDRAFVSGVSTDPKRSETVPFSYWAAEIIFSDDGRIKWYAAFKMNPPTDSDFTAIHPVS